MVFAFRVVVACTCLLAVNAHAQTSSLKVDARNSQKLSELTPPPERYLPTVYLLQDPSIQSALAINEEQRSKIAAIAKTIRDPGLLRQMESSAHNFPEFSQVADPQQRTELELRAACQLHLSRLLELEVLSTEQFARLKQLRIRLSGMVYFLSSQSTTDLSLTPEQRSMILLHHSQLIRESHSVSTLARKELKVLSGVEKLEANRLLNKKIGDLERDGVVRVVRQLNEDQQACFHRLAGPAIELCRESLNMRIAIDSQKSD